MSAFIKDKSLKGMFMQTKNELANRFNSTLPLSRRSLLLLGGSGIVAFQVPSVAAAAETIPKLKNYRRSGPSPGGLSLNLPIDRLTALKERLSALSGLVDATIATTQQDQIAARQVTSDYNTLAATFPMMTGVQQISRDILIGVSRRYHNVEVIASLAYLSSKLSLKDQISSVLSDSSNNFGIDIALDGEPTFLCAGVSDLQSCDQFGYDQMVLRSKLKFQMVPNEIDVTVRTVLSFNVINEKIVMARARSTRIEGAEFWKLSNSAAIASQVIPAFNNMVDKATISDSFPGQFNIDIGQVKMDANVSKKENLVTSSLSCSLTGGLRIFAYIWSQTTSYEYPDGHWEDHPTPAQLSTPFSTTEDMTPILEPLPTQFEIILKIPSKKIADHLTWNVYEQVSSRFSSSEWMVSSPIPETGGSIVADPQNPSLEVLCWPLKLMTWSPQKCVQGALRWYDWDLRYECEQWSTAGFSYVGFAVYGNLNVISSGTRQSLQLVFSAAGKDIPFDLGITANSINVTIGTPFTIVNLSGV